MDQERKLDLGGTQGYEDPDSVCISLDGSSFEWPNVVTPTVCGNYNRMPFSDEMFDLAQGGCYLEEEFNAHELFRVLKPGGKAIVTGCHAYDCRDAEMMLQWTWNLTSFRAKFEHAGFVVTTEFRGSDEHQIDELLWHLYKPDKPDGPNYSWIKAKKAFEVIKVWMVDQFGIDGDTVQVQEIIREQIDEAWEKYAHL